MRLVQSDTFTANGTWNKHPNACLVIVRVYAGGGGGGASATGGGAGSAGGGGASMEASLLASELGPTESVTVGAGGSGGTSSGQAGGAGGVSAFGAWLSAYGGGGGITFGASTSSGGGGGGAQSAGAAGASTASKGGDPSIAASGPGQYGGGGSTVAAATANNAHFGGGAGGCSGNGGGAAGGTGGASVYGGGGGGGGGDGSAGGAGGDGGPRTDGALRGNGGTAGATTPTAGGAGAAGSGRYAGSGGGGGGSNATGAAGGVGGIPSGGGGGGGWDGSTVRAGGNGARGEIRVYQYGLDAVWGFDSPARGPAQSRTPVSSGADVFTSLGAAPALTAWGFDSPAAMPRTRVPVALQSEALPPIAAAAGITAWGSEQSSLPIARPPLRSSSNDAPLPSTMEPFGWEQATAVARAPRRPDVRAPDPIPAIFAYPWAPDAPTTRPAPRLAPRSSADHPLPSDPIPAAGWETPSLPRIARVPTPSSSDPIPPLASTGLAAWGWDVQSTSRGPAPLRRPESSTPLPPLSVVALITWTPDVAAIPTRRSDPRWTTPTPLPGLATGAWGWEQSTPARRTFPIDRGQVAQAMALPAPIVPALTAWGWDLTTPRQSPATSPARSSASDVLPILPRAPWGWEGGGQVVPVPVRNQYRSTETALPPIGAALVAWGWEQPHLRIPPTAPIVLRVAASYVWGPLVVVIIVTPGTAEIRAIASAWATIEPVAGPSAEIASSASTSATIEPIDGPSAEISANPSASATIRKM